MVRIAITGAIAAAAASTNASVTLYEQQPAGGVALVSHATGGNDFAFADRRRADNFSLSVDSTIETIRFWGGDESVDNNPDLNNLTGFELTFYANDGGAPGAVLADFTVSLAATSPTTNGLIVGLLNAPMYEFNTDLATPLDLPAGDYFFSVAAILVNPVGIFAEGFQWAGSLPGDGVFFSDSFDGNGYQDASTFARTNAAFEFIGVPAPSAAATFALAALAATRRRR